MVDFAGLGRDLARGARSATEKQIAPLIERITSLEAQNVELLGKIDTIAEASAETMAMLQDTVESLSAKAADMLAEIARLSEAPPPAPGTDGKDGEPGRDAATIEAAQVSDAGELILEMSDGKTFNAGLVRGRDGVGAPGKDGADGRDGISLAAARLNDDGELILKMTDGETTNVGRVRGRDGMGFDDLVLEHDGEREATLVLRRGDVSVEHKLHLPIPIYRGVFRDGVGYQAGDMVTHAGSVWEAQHETADRPTEKHVGDRGAAPWRLAVKRGRDAKTPVSGGAK